MFQPLCSLLQVFPFSPFSLFLLHHRLPLIQLPFHLYSHAHHLTISVAVVSHLTTSHATHTETPISNQITSLQPIPPPTKPAGNTRPPDRGHDAPGLLARRQAHPGHAVRRQRMRRASPSRHVRAPPGTLQEIRPLRRHRSPHEATDGTRRRPERGLQTRRPAAGVVPHFSPRPRQRLRGRDGG